MLPAVGFLRVLRTAYDFEILASVSREVREAHGPRLCYFRASGVETAFARENHTARLKPCPDGANRQGSLSKAQDKRSCPQGKVDWWHADLHLR